MKLLLMYWCVDHHDSLSLALKASLDASDY